MVDEGDREMRMLFSWLLVVGEEEEEGEAAPRGEKGRKMRVWVKKIMEVWLWCFGRRWRREKGLIGGSATMRRIGEVGRFLC
ncbi:hypothetical protein HAX54_052614, partial [Datura stramonium]|nr:hypothetical protein [Datura stramonium]